MASEQVVGSFCEGELPQVVAELAAESFLKVMRADSTLNSNDLRVPVEFSEVVKEESKQLHWSFHLEVIDQEYDEDV